LYDDDDDNVTLNDDDDVTLNDDHEVTLNEMTALEVFVEQ